MYYIYMLRCRDGSFYTGIAADIEKRLRQHASGGAACAKYTRAHPPEALAALWQAEDHAAAARLEALIKQRVARIPMGFAGDGRDTANAVLFLASDEARFITGTELVVDGGMSVRCG